MGWLLGAQISYPDSPCNCDRLGARISRLALKAQPFEGVFCARPTPDSTFAHPIRNLRLRHD
jgi:hypothetical protein